MRACRPTVQRKNAVRRDRSPIDPRAAIKAAPTNEAQKTASTKRACCFLEVTPGFEPGSEGFADLCLTTWPRHQLYKIVGAEAPKCHFGAGDEARTRYLHLGKVALYRMSYTRIWCLRSESNQRHADFQSAALPAELQRHIEVSRSSPLLLFGDPERTRTVDLQRDRLAC